MIEQSLALLKRRPRLLLTVLAAIALIAALLRPGITWTGPAHSTLLVVDITQSMNVADMSWEGQTVTRLEYVRSLLRQAVREMPCGNQIGLGVFTERTTLTLLAPLEVCAHYAALSDSLEGLDWRMAWAADSHIFYGTYSALDTIAARWPGTALAMFTDGHQAPPFFPGYEPRYERTAQTPPGVLFGIGADVPQPVPRMDSDGRITGYWTADEAAAIPSGGGRPSVGAFLESESAKQGGSPRSKSQRPLGATSEHLSARRDSTLNSVASVTGLEARVPTNAADVVATLQSLPASNQALQRLDLHDPLVMLAALTLVASLLPWRALDSAVAVSDTESHVAANKPPPPSSNLPTDQPSPPPSSPSQATIPARDPPVVSAPLPAVRTVSAV